MVLTCLPASQRNMPLTQKGQRLLSVGAGPVGWLPLCVIVFLVLLSISPATASRSSVCSARGRNAATSGAFVFEFTWTIWWAALVALAVALLSTLSRYVWWIRFQQCAGWHRRPSSQRSSKGTAPKQRLLRRLLAGVLIFGNFIYALAMCQVEERDRTKDRRSSTRLGSYARATIGSST